MTTGGFYSIVQHRDDPNLMLVRTRTLEDIETFVDKVNEFYHEVIEIRDSIKRKEDHDYRFRVIVPKTVVTSWLDGVVSEARYDNFKDAVAQVNRGRASVYGKIWSVLRMLQI